MFYTHPDQVAQRCLREDETYAILRTCHDAQCRGHFAAKRSTYKIMTTRYYRPTLHKDATKHTRHSDRCQQMGHPTKSDEMALQPQIVVTPFDKQGINFVGPIEPSSHGKSYILLCTDYATKWLEAKAMRHARDNKVAEFLYECMFTRFGVPREIVMDQGTHFTSNLISKLMNKYMVHHGKYSPYQPLSNGQAEITNWEIESILTKTIFVIKKDWDTNLLESIWAYHTTWKNIIGFTPFELVYGKLTSMPIEF